MNIAHSLEPTMEVLWAHKMVVGVKLIGTVCRTVWLHPISCLMIFSKQEVRISQRRVQGCRSVPTKAILPVHTHLLGISIQTTRRYFQLSVQNDCFRRSEVMW